MYNVSVYMYGTHTEISDMYPTLNKYQLSTHNYKACHVRRTALRERLHCNRLINFQSYEVHALMA